MMADQKLELTEEALKAAKFRGPVRFYDGRKGMAQQDFECVLEPRFGYSWRRESRQEKGRQFYTVDGNEVADLSEACKLLALPPDPNSQRELLRRFFEDSKKSPMLNYGATRANNHAEMNACAGPFGTVRSWMYRAENAWHNGINQYADIVRDPNAPNTWPRWLYNAKSAMHETYRGVYLFENDRKTDTGLRCALGTRCRDCPILKTIEGAMTASRERDKFPSGVEDEDIDAAKVSTCIGHVLQTKQDIIDGVFFSTTASRGDYP